MHYAEKFEIFYSLVSEVDRDEASFVARLQEIFNDSNELKVLKFTWPAFMKISGFCRCFYCGRLVGIVRLRTKTTEFNFLVAVFNKGGKNHKYVV
jgi:hypothetical protein